MVTETSVWLDSLVALHKSQMRQAAAQFGLPLVHLEILQYLAQCNAYSNTAQALSEYLGQTKGSISQSLKVLEEAGRIERKPCVRDGRVTRITVTQSGQDLLNRLTPLSVPDMPQEAQIVDSLRRLLSDWQRSNGQHGFAQCLTCRHHQPHPGTGHLCGLTGDVLTPPETQKICREHSFG